MAQYELQNFFIEKNTKKIDLFVDNTINKLNITIQDMINDPQFSYFVSGSIFMIKNILGECDNIRGLKVTPFLFKNHYNLNDLFDKKHIHNLLELESFINLILYKLFNKYDKKDGFKKHYIQTFLDVFIFNSNINSAILNKANNLHSKEINLTYDIKYKIIEKEFELFFEPHLIDTISQTHKKIINLVDDLIFIRHFNEFYNRELSCEEYNELYQHSSHLEEGHNIYSKSFFNKYKKLPKQNIFMLVIDQKTKSNIFSLVSGLYNKHFIKNSSALHKMRQHFLYEKIGRTTINQISYLKKALLSLNSNVNYIQEIESKPNEYEKVLSETPNIFHASYSLIGFQGLDQARIYKDTLRGKFTVELSQSIKIPLTKKGWKFLINQSSHYLIRATRNINLGNFCLNNELKDAWLRNEHLNYFFGPQNDLFPSYCIDLISKSINNHNGPVSKYKPFKNKVYKIMHFDGKYDSKIKEKFLSEFINNKLTPLLIVKKDLPLDLTNAKCFFHTLFFMINYYGFKFSSTSTDKKIKKLFSLFLSVDLNIESHPFGQRKLYCEEYKKYYQLFKNDDALIPFININTQQFNINEFNLEYINNEFQFLYFDIYQSMTDFFQALKDENYEKLYFLYEELYFLKNNSTVCDINKAYNLINDYLYDLFLNTYAGYDIEHVRKIINKNVRDLSHLFDLSDRWHLENIKANQPIETVTYPYPFLDKDIFINAPVIDFEGISFEIILDSNKLYNEGVNMSHCVYRYSGRCYKNQYVVFHMTGSRLIEDVTVGVNILNSEGSPTFTLDQAFGYENKNVYQSQLRIIERFINKLNMN